VNFTPFFQDIQVIAISPVNSRMSPVKEETTTTATTKKSRNPYARRYSNSNSTIAQPPPEKDGTEKALEKLLFGDDDGFYEALKKHRGPLDFEGALVRVGEEFDVDDVVRAGEEGEEGEGEDEDIEQVADDDVSIFLFSASGSSHAGPVDC
jgi:hypothetical protein